MKEMKRRFLLETKSGAEIEWKPMFGGQTAAMQRVFQRLANQNGGMLCSDSVRAANMLVEELKKEYPGTTDFRWRETVPEKVEVEVGDLVRHHDDEGMQFVVLGEGRYPGSLWTMCVQTSNPNAVALKSVWSGESCHSLRTVVGGHEIAGFTEDSD